MHVSHMQMQPESSEPFSRKYGLNGNVICSTGELFYVQSKKESYCWPCNISPEATKANDNLESWGNNEGTLYTSHYFLESLHFSKSGASVNTRVTYNRGKKRSWRGLVNNL